MSGMPSTTLLAQDIAAIFAKSGVRDRTIEKYLKGGRVWASTKRKIDNAMHELGFAEHIPDQTKDSQPVRLIKTG